MYYDDSKNDIIIEISGVGYGNHDRLFKIMPKEHFTILASSLDGKLYQKKGELYYSNKALKIDIKLEKKEYSSKIDYKRKQLFGVKAFAEVSRLKDSLQLKDYKFDWDIKSDYEYYRDNTSLPEEYIPEYKKKVLRAVH